MIAKETVCILIYMISYLSTHDNTRLLTSQILLESINRANHFRLHITCTIVHSRAHLSIELFWILDFKYGVKIIIIIIIIITTIQDRMCK